jgi:hypothetical protein
MAGVAVLWLFLGEWSGHTAINLFNLTFAGVAVLFATLALRGNAILSVIVGSGIGGLMFVIASRNLDASTLAFAPALVLSLVTCTAAAAFRPSAFMRWRAPRAFAVALVVPIVLFVVEAISP